MRIVTVIIICLGLFRSVHAQGGYPVDYFVNPMEIPLVLSGTFGELRSNHFHAGLDIKTMQKEGIPVVSSAEGYVSRINVSLWGYGNAIYITHPNGFTTVYGHLREFSPEIDAYVRKSQYEKESFTIRLFPKAGELRVSKGQLIAYSGNSGSSGGPHLHYEIRDVKQNILNPMLFGIDIPDHKNPSIQAAFAYSANDSSHVNRSGELVQLVINRRFDGDLEANPITAYGKIGFGINAYDRLDGALNKNGLYELEMTVDGRNLFAFKADRFSFDESRWINSYIDYARFKKLKQRVQKCFVEHEQNKLSLYKELNNKGFLEIADSTDYEVVITARDFAGNKTRLIVPVQGRKDSIVVAKDIKATDYFFKASEVNQISDSLVAARFPKDIFYEDFYFDYKYEDGVAKLHDESVPVHRNFELSFDVAHLDAEELKYYYIAKRNSVGKWYYVNTAYKNNKLNTSSKALGDFTLKTDKEKPVVTPIGFKEGQWLTKHSKLKVRIYDKGSGIKYFRGELDGKWIRMAFNPKNGVLTYDFKDRRLETPKHELKVVVRDNVNNETIYRVVFNKKT